MQFVFRPNLFIQSEIILLRRETVTEVNSKAKKFGDLNSASTHFTDNQPKKKKSELKEY